MAFPPPIAAPRILKTIVTISHCLPLRYAANDAPLVFAALLECDNIADYHHSERHNPSVCNAG